MAHFIPGPEIPNDLAGYPAGKSVWVDGVKVRFSRVGAGTAVVLVHGLLGYSFSWRRVIPLLAARFEVLTPDLPGAGFSDCDLSVDCRLSSACKRLLAFLDASGVGTCDFIGSSYGGATAMMLAAMAPSRVRRLVLVSPANPWSKTGRLRLAMLRNPAIARAFPKVAFRTPALHDYFLRRMWGNPRKLTPEEYAGYSAPLRRPSTFEYAVKIVQTWKPDMAELRDILPRIARVPTLLVWGSKDRTVDPASAEPLRREFQSGRLAVIEGAGHLPYEECPEEFSRIVSEFLDEPTAECGAPEPAVQTGK